jgi:hypothetical protein
MVKLSFKQRFWKVGRWYLVLFLVLFLFRFTYGYFNKSSADVDNYVSDFFSNVENLRKNYASDGKRFKSHTVIWEKGTPPPVPSANVSTNQKYEKTATVRAKTSSFEKEAQRVKTMASDFGGVIQYEQNLGNKGDREMHLLVGIVPEKFDSFYVEIQKIGLVRSMEITKIDKTNEYRQLNAKKLSLEKTLLSLNELKTKGGTIVDYLALNDKILEMENNLQELGVELGNFDTENEFCSIKYSLYEGEVEKKITLMRRLKVALEWTIKYYFVLVMTSVLLLVSVFLFLLVLDKFNVIKNISEKIRE